MDPLTAALNLATESIKAFVQIYEGASAEQKQQLVDFWIEDQKFWRSLFDRLKPPKKETP